MNDQKYLRRAEAAAYLQKQYGAYSVQTLAKLASIGGGPRFQKMGAFPLYKIDDLDAWALSRMSASVNSTAELMAS